jgi:hypothetical protein
MDQQVLKKHRIDQDHDHRGEKEPG